MCFKMTEKQPFFKGNAPLFVISMSRTQLEREFGHTKHYRVARTEKQMFLLSVFWYLAISSPFTVKLRPAAFKTSNSKI